MHVVRIRTNITARMSPARWLRQRVPEHIIAALAAVRRAGEREAKHCSFVCEPDRKG